jgi:YaiO family outer membrane protein
MSVHPRTILTLAVLLVSSLAGAQQPTPPIPQGSSLPEGSSLPLGMNGPGYLEVGGDFFDVTGNPNWADAYANLMISGGGNVLTTELTRQDRYGGTGWYYSFGWTRSWGQSWYSDLAFGSSTVSGFFIPRVRTDAHINRKLLPRKQLVLTLGGGYDLSKTVNWDYRGQIGGIYYFERPWVVQGNVTWTHADPGNILAQSQSIAVTEGHEKEHYVTFTANFGREGYEIVGVGQSIENFRFQDYQLNWRQWIGLNWGFTITPEYETNFFYQRRGGTVGFFLEF